MKNAQFHRFIGFIVLSISLILFLTLFFGVNKRNGGEGVFILNYVFAVFYFIVFVFERRELKSKNRAAAKEFSQYIYPISLVLFSISAHSLNYGTEISVFAPYTGWMSVLVVLMHVAILAFPYRKQLPIGLQYVLYALCGMGALISFYLTLFILPVMLISVPAIVLLGLSSHSFVPLLWLIYFIQANLKLLEFPRAKSAYVIGLVLPLLVLTGFLYKWKVVQNQIEKVQTAYALDLESELPEWVVLSQHLPNDPLTESVLMSNAFTQKSVWQGENIFGSRTRANGSLSVTHNPLAVIAGSLFGSLEIDRTTMKSVLEAKYDLRHETHRRLWSGSALSTAKVKTEMEVYPDFRLAYVEKTLDIHFNPERNGWWRSQQEAVYTFYLPEGSVATSLSLWINGVEEKSRLTTKGKADSAYVEIVGVERRDPALLHWQEGNRVSVTVFPCTKEEDRIFKIGFTMPLAYKEGRLHVDNVYFDGPEVSDTREEVHIKFKGTVPQDLSLPPSLKKVSEREYKLEAKYAPNWQMSWEAPAVSSAPFTFQNQTYTMMSLQKEASPWKAKEVVLDITAAWKPWELAGIWELVKDKDVYVFNPKKTRLNAENYEEIIKELAQKQFSFLPLHDLFNLGQTLVISSGTENAPLLSEVEDSRYSYGLRSFLFNSHEPLKWYNLRSEVSPYVQSLESFGMLDFTLGNMDGLKELLAEGEFPQVEENDRQIALHQSDILIKKEFIEEGQVEDSPENLAPDHVMRLFRYNELLHHIGKAYFVRDALEEIWIRKAEEAYVVSPVSSMIVLETIADYERMGIEENENTLGNAKMKNSGSVPEPHEWALIMLVLVVAVWQLKGRFF